MSVFFIFSHDPGGANAVAPLVKPLKEKGHEVLLYGKGPALGVYQRSGLEGNDITAFGRGTTQDDIKRFIKELSPDAIITATSAEDMTERFIWKASRELDILSMAVLDQWMNYGIRFSGYGISQMDRYREDGRHTYLPGMILVMDELARKEAVREGLDESMIAITGQPHFETVLKRVRSFSHSDKTAVKAKLGVKDGGLVLLYASEPITKDYGPLYRGYDERTVLADIAHGLLGAEPFLEKDVTVVVRPHPREDHTHYSDVPEELSDGKIKYVVDSTTDSLLLISASDAVVGMSSMFLIEAAMAGKPVLSVQTGLTGEDPFVLSRLGITRTVTDKDELSGKLRELLLDGKTPSVAFDPAGDPVEKIISLVEAKICRN